MIKIFKLLIILLVLVVYANFLGFFSRKYNADISDKMSEKLLGTSVEDALMYSNAAILNNPDEPSYYIQRAKVYLVLGYDYKKFAQHDLEVAYTINPRNLATLRNSIPVYYFLAIKNLAELVSYTNLDVQYMDQTFTKFEQLEKYVPNDAGSLVVLARYYKKLGSERDYLRIVTKIRLLRPDLLDWAIN